MRITELFEGRRTVILDGGMGTMLQKAGLGPEERPELLALTRPALLEDIHRQYLEAGSRVLYANTFGASRKKLAGTGHGVEEIVTASLEIARRAAQPYGALVALDMGPLGEMLEPAGPLSF